MNMKGLQFLHFTNKCRLSHLQRQIKKNYKNKNKNFFEKYSCIINLFAIVFLDFNQISLFKGN